MTPRIVSWILYSSELQGAGCVISVHMAAGGRLHVVVVRRTGRSDDRRRDHRRRRSAGRHRHRPRRSSRAHRTRQHVLLLNSGVTSNSGARGQISKSSHLSPFPALSPDSAPFLPCLFPTLSFPFPLSLTLITARASGGAL